MTDLDPLLHEAMTRVRGPVNTRPSLTDVRRRARRRNRRRMSATVGVVACAGVATTALVIRRDGMGPASVGGAADSSLASDTPTTTFLSEVIGSTTTVYGSPTLTITPGAVWDALWNARYDPSGAGREIGAVDQAAADVMPTAQQFGCSSVDCEMMFTYVVWHEIAKTAGFGDVIEMQAANPNIDFSVPPVDGAVVQTPYSAQVVPPDVNGNETPTTVSVFEGIMLIDAGAPAGAMEDAYQRLPGYDRTIVPGTGKHSEQTMVMPIGDNGAMASSVGAIFGVGVLDTWDSSFLGTPIQGMVAVIVGADYWDRVQQAATASTTTTSSTTTSLAS